MSDSDEPDKSSSSSASSDDEPPRKVARKKKTPSPEPEAITAEAAFSQISGLAERLRMKTKKSISAGLNWRQVLSALHEGVIAKGIPERVLGEMWYILSTPGRHIKMPQRKDLIFLLIPEKVVSVDFVEILLDWFIREHSEKQFKTLLIPLLKYFLGLVEYALIDGECFCKSYNYSSLLACSENTVLIIPLFQLLKKVTTKEVIQRFHVLTISCLWKKALVANQKKFIVDLLKLYKALRPDYIPGHVFHINIAIKSRINDKGNVAEVFRQRLFEAKRRTTGAQMHEEINKAEDDLEKSAAKPMDLYDQVQLINGYFFPELAPQFGDEFSLKMILSDTKREEATIPKMKKMLWSLLNTTTVPLLLVDGELLECFQTWVSINFDHKFSQYDDKHKRRYEFVLQKCIEVTTLLGDGLTVVDDWLPRYLMNWDTQLFRSQILELFSYLNILDFSDECIKLMLKKFEHDFLCGPQIRSYEVWTMFEKLLSRWLQLYQISELAQHEETIEEEAQDNIAEAIDALVLFMKSLSKSHTALHGPCIVYDEIFGKIINRQQIKSSGQ